MRHRLGKTSPDWRWVRAKYLADNKLPASRTRDDKHIRRARTFLLKLQPLDMHAEERLMDQEPTLYAAWRIHDREQTLQYMYDQQFSGLSKFESDLRSGLP